MSETPSTPRWGMVVDLNRCVGCQTCTIACKQSNDTPPGVQWRQVLDIEHGSYPDVQREFLVVGCQHCAEPSCVPVCPTGATRQRADGLVTMDYDLCLGCGYCAVACPYQARTIVHDKSWYYGSETIQERIVGHDERIGVAQKCTFCVERVDEGIELGRVPGVDLDYTPVCSASCVAQAISFGDFNDGDSNVSRLVKDNPGFQMHAQLGNDPQIRYLYEAPAIPGRDGEPSGLVDEAMSDHGNPLVGVRQTLWDCRAAMNFILGGMGSGLAMVAVLAYFLRVLPPSDLPVLLAVAGLLMAVGLFFVFLEIGRKKRFLYVLLRPHSSWMTRETYFVILFYPAVAADLLWPRPWLHAVAACTALGFLICQARILYAGKGIPAWRAPLIPWLILLSGLLEGIGLLALMDVLAFEQVLITGEMAVLGTVLSVLAGLLWILYRLTSKQSGIPPLARQALDRVSPATTIIGHVLPLIGFLALEGPQGGPFFQGIAALLAGTGAVLGGIIWKYAVITKACHQQGFALPKLPRRGSGTRAAPYRSGLGARDPGPV